MTVRFDTAREAEAYLLSLVNYETRTRYRRDTTTHDLVSFRRRLVDAGWLPGRVSTVHVGGTNGKGSTAMLLETLLRAGGKRTGLYTSPHLRDIRERIQIGGRPISPALFCELTGFLAGRVDPEARGIRTTFEHLTAAAFLAFQRLEVDWAVVEVGLGGRLDATNVLPPGKAVLTPISLDHENVLGRGLEAIARDKAHIFKAGGEAWIMAQPPEARAALAARLNRESLTALDPDGRVQVVVVTRDEAGTVFRIRGRREYGTVATRLMGEHQARNLAAAVAVCETILTEEEVERAVPGLAGVVLPARLQVVHRWGKIFVVDGGHNPGAAQAVAEALAAHFPGRRVAGILGLARDKDITGYVDAVAPVLARVVGTASRNPRAAAPAIVAAAAGRHMPALHTESVRQALDAAASGPEDIILVGGSFIVAGEALGWLGV